MYLGTHWVMLVYLISLVLILVFPSLRPAWQVQATGREGHMPAQLRRERIDRALRFGPTTFSLSPTTATWPISSCPGFCPWPSFSCCLFVLPVYWVHTFIMVAVYALLAMSWDFIHSAGMISLGHSFMFGVGAMRPLLSTTTTIFPRGSRYPWGPSSVP